MVDYLEVAAAVVVGLPSSAWEGEEAEGEAYCCCVVIV